MSPLPRSSPAPQRDPVYGDLSEAQPPPRELAESFPADQVDPGFLEDAEVTSPSQADHVESGMRVTDYLQAAIDTAEEEGMSPSELIGLFFYYAHSLAEEGREAAARAFDEAESAPAQTEDTSG